MNYEDAANFCLKKKKIPGHVTLFAAERQYAPPKVFYYKQLNCWLFRPLYGPFYWFIEQYIY